LSSVRVMSALPPKADVGSTPTSGRRLRRVSKWKRGVALYGDIAADRGASALSD
jgi:hypothetical protein